MANALDLLSSRNWLITAEGMETLMTVAQRHGDVEALETRRGRKLDNTRHVTMRDGVAVIPVTGPIFRYANLFTEVSGAVSTQMLATDIQTALDDPAVRAIVLDADSPGGEATGINELSDLIYNARSQKRIVTYVSGMAASAMYWIGSAAGEIVVDDTAQLGSVGVVMTLAMAAQRDGAKSFEIVSSNAPNKRPNPETESGRAQLQARVDELASVFLDKVARNRGIRRDQVNDRFRQGGIATGALAMEAGMADRLGSLESLIAELAGTSTSASNSQRRLNMTTVRTTAEFRAALSRGVDPKTIQVAAAAAQSLDLAQIRQTATLNERIRCRALLNLAGKENERLAIQAIDEGGSVESLGLQLFQTRQEQAARERTVGAITKRWRDQSAAEDQPGSTPAQSSSDTITAITKGFRRQ